MTDWDGLARPSLRGLERYDPGASRDELKARARAGRAGAAELERGSVRAAAGGAGRRRGGAAAARRSTRSGRSPTSATRWPAGWACRRRSVIPAHGAQALIGTIAAAFVDPGTRVVIPQADLRPLRAGVGRRRRAGDAGRPAHGLAIDLDARGGGGARAAARGWSGCAIPTTRPATLIDARPLVGVPGRAAGRLRRRRRRGLHGLRRPGRCGPTGWPTSRDGRPVIVIRSFSKIFGLAGLRLGYAVADPARRPAARHRPGAVQRQPGRAGRRPRGRGRARLRRRAPGARWPRRARCCASELDGGRHPHATPRTPTSCWSSWASTTGRCATALLRRGRADPRRRRVRAARIRAGDGGAAAGDAAGGGGDRGRAGR